MLKDVVCQTPDGTVIPLDEAGEMNIVNVSIDGETVTLTVI